MRFTNDFWQHQLAPSVGKNDSSCITTSLTKSCMVLTRLMVTNNNQGDEPRTTALERQVQTLAAVMEHLTKQNHDLEK